MRRQDVEGWVSGYHGEDSMRNKAHQMIREEMAGARDGNRDRLLGGIPESMSSPAHTKMRPYKQGGHAHHGHHRKGHKKHHYGIGGMIAGKMAAPLLNKIPGVGGLLGGLASSLGSFLPFEEGGHVSKKKGGRMHRMPEYQTDMHIPRRHKSKPLNVETFQEAERLRHGGQAHHKRHHKKHYGRGGEILGKVASPLLNKIPYVGDALGNIASSFGHLLPFEDGGHVKHSPYHKKQLKELREAMHSIHAEERHAKHHRGHKRHHKADGGLIPFLSDDRPAFAKSTQKGTGLKRGGHHKASGGTMYEHQMVGEMKAKPHHFNYESEMMGEHEERAPRRVAVSKKGMVDKNHSQMFERGGMVDTNRGQMFKCAGGEMKRAAGGVAKMRHEVADKRGQPKGGKHRTHTNMF